MREMLRLVNLINMNLMYKKKYFETKLFKNATPLFKILIRLRIVNFIKKNGNGFLFFLNLETKLKLAPMLKKSKKHISYFNIKRICDSQKWIAILSTSKGLLTTKDCIAKKVGGLILFNVLVL